MPTRLASRLLPTCGSLLLLAAGCLPTHSASLSIPLRTSDGKSHDKAVVTIPVHELQCRMEGFRLEQLAIYAWGREPVPFRVVAAEGAGQSLELVTRVTGDGKTRLLAVCPGPQAAEMAPADPALPRVAPDLAGIHR